MTQQLKPVVFCFFLTSRSTVEVSTMVVDRLRQTPNSAVMRETHFMNLGAEHKTMVLVVRRSSQLSFTGYPSVCTSFIYIFIYKFDNILTLQEGFLIFNPYL